MSHRARCSLFLVAGAGLLAVLVIGFHGLQPFGDVHSVYLRVIKHVELGARHATDYVTSLNFDIRAFDTLGEEFILFAAVTGVVLVFRGMHEEMEEEPRRDEDADRFGGGSEALQALSVSLIALATVLGVYLALHGAITPGGGFQAGVVLAGGPVAVMLGGRYLLLARMAPDWVLELLESSGACGYALIGLGGLVFGGVYLENFLPYGTAGQLISAGTMLPISVAIGMEVAGGLLIASMEFLEQALLPAQQGS